MRSVTVSPLALDLPFQFRIPHSALRTQRECPRLAERSLSSLSAAPCEGLTLFTSGRPADLGHRKLACRLRVLYGQRRTPPPPPAPPLRPRASRLLEPALHGVHARVQRLVARGVRGIEHAGVASRGVVC